ncbi:MAG: hypothetical protein HGA38_03485 [Candidatus Moranbacteria bacterium]|nr:hypothetical protein [Candidatus Moranbacteria bacterium]
MKRIWEIRSVVAAASLALLGGAAFAVLHGEEEKRLEARDARLDDFLTSLRVQGDAREVYLGRIASERDGLRRLMEDARARYDELLGRQPELVEESRQTTTKTVTETVPVQVPVTKPSSSRTTKSS